MANSINHAALPYPIKGARYTLPILYRDADGDPTDPTTPDTEISKDGNAFVDCAEEVTVIFGSNGAGYITLTGDEMNATLIAICAKATSGPKASLLTLQPRLLPVLRSGSAQGGTSESITLDSGASAIDDYYNGCILRTTGGTGGGGGFGSLNNQARVIIDYSGTSKVAVVAPGWEVNAASGTIFEILATETWIARLSNVVGWSGSGVATPDTAGYPKVTVKQGTGAGELSLASGVVAANAAQISGDATAADNLETMLDGTGGQQLKLGRLVIDQSGTDATLFIRNSGAGSGIFIQGGTQGHGVDVLANGTGMSGVHLKGFEGPGLTVVSINSNGAYFLAGGSNAGAVFQGGSLGGPGAIFRGGSTSGDGLRCEVTNGIALNAPVNAFTSAAKAELQTEAQEALQAYHLDHLIASADPGGVVANNSFLAKLVSKNATAAFNTYDNTTDSLEATAAAEIWAAPTRTLTSAETRLSPPTPHPQISTTQYASGETSGHRWNSRSAQAAA